MPQRKLDQPRKLPVPTAGKADRLPLGACGHCRVGADLRDRRSFRQDPAPRRARLHSDLSVRARHQRPDHRGPALRAVRPAAFARAVVARGRISLHGRDGGRAHADVPGPVRARRAARRRPAKHRLALHVLARRLPAHGDRLRADERPQRRHGRCGAADGTRHRAEHRRGRGRSRGADLARDRGRRGASPDHARPRLYARADRRRVDGVAAEPRGARGAVAAPPALRARRLADGRDGLLAVRHRARRGAQRRPFRRRLLCGAGLWLAGRELRAHRPAARNRRALRAPCTFVQGAAAKGRRRDIQDRCQIENGA